MRPSVNGEEELASECTALVVGAVAGGSGGEEAGGAEIVHGAEDLVGLGIFYNTAKTQEIIDRNLLKIH